MELDASTSLRRKGGLEAFRLNLNVAYSVVSQLSFPLNKDESLMLLTFVMKTISRIQKIELTSL